MITRTGDNQNRERIFSPEPLFRDSQIPGRQRQDRGDSLSLSQAMLGKCCCGRRTVKPVAVDGWVQLDVVESSRVASLRSEDEVVSVPSGPSVDQYQTSG